MLHQLILATGSLLAGFTCLAAIAQAQVTFSNVSPGTIEPVAENINVLQSATPATLSVSVPPEVAAQISILPPSLVEGASNDPSGTTRVGFVEFGANSLRSDSQNNTASLPTGNTDLAVRMRVERPVAFSPGSYTYRLTLSVTLTPP